MRVLRAMKADEDGKPTIDNTARTLGVRIGGRRPDVVVAASGFVLPETGGLSVSPPPPANLPEHRRPEEYCGVERDPVWEMNIDCLPPMPTYRQDPNTPDRHGFVEPDRPMHMYEYEAFLRPTQTRWRPVRSDRDAFNELY